MKKFCFLALVLTCLFILIFLIARPLGVSRGRATIQEKTLTIKTYLFSDPDPVPILARSGDWKEGARLYPYFHFDKFSKAAIEKEWTAILLENPYIRLAVLPGVGGKIWGATEKSENWDFIYTNHVLKFREIALRGPWTSGGIEFNFGIIGHAPWTAARVDYLLRKNDDGSVSCVVGTLDLPSRSRWTVTITLPKDKAYIETSAFWFNPTPYNQSDYSWMTPAVKASKDLKYIFPGRFQIGHDFSVPPEPWPVDGSGRDLSWYQNNDFGGSKSYFTVGQAEDFFGCYYTDSGRGFGHWAPYADVPGRKVWIWDLSRAGEIWVDLLTDKDGQYSEPQAGRLLNQSDHEFLRPQTANRWKEIWFPYKKTGPMVAASPAGVLNATPSAESLKLSFCALEPIDEDLVLVSEEKELFRKHLRLKPLDVFEESIPSRLSKSKGFKVSLGNSLSYSSDPKAKDIRRPFCFKVYDEATAEGLFLGASRLEKERNYHLALQKYQACLEKEPGHIRALTRTAELYCRQSEYEKGLGFARRALENSMYDPEASYVYALISRRLGDLVDAKETLGWAARSMEYRSAAYLQLAEIYLIEGNLHQTLEYARRSLDYNKFNVNALQVMAISYRKMGQPRKAKETLFQVLGTDPLNHLARFEIYLQDPTQKNLEDFQSMIRSELPNEIYLELAAYYSNLGLIDEAVGVLREAPDYPIIDYWLAYLLREKSPRDSENYLARASGFSPLLVFPHREEDAPVLRWASEKRPADWKPKYYLGLLSWSRGRIAETTELFEKCGEPDFAPFYLARGYLYQETEPKRALAEYEKAVRADEKNWRCWHFLIRLSQKIGMKEKALDCAHKAGRLFPDETPITVDLVHALMADGRWAEAASILDKIEALPSEGAIGIHRMFVECEVKLALEKIRAGVFERAIQLLEKSMTYPERLGTGKPFDPDNRMQDYLAALCYDKLGNHKKAEETRKSILDYTLRKWDEKTQFPYYGGLVLQHFGEREKARKLLGMSAPPKEIREIIKMLK